MPAALIMHLLSQYTRPSLATTFLQIWFSSEFTMWLCSFILGVSFKWKPIFVIFCKSWNYGGHLVDDTKEGMMDFTGFRFITDFFLILIFSLIEKPLFEKWSLQRAIACLLAPMVWGTFLSTSKWAIACFRGGSERLPG